MKLEKAKNRHNFTIFACERVSLQKWHVACKDSGGDGNHEKKEGIINIVVMLAYRVLNKYTIQGLIPKYSKLN